MEQDDYASLIRYLLYTNDLDTEGLIYTSGRFHWAGDGKGTLFFLPDREYTTPQTGQTISLILQATDDGSFPLTRYARVILRVPSRST